MRSACGLPGTGNARRRRNGKPKRASEPVKPVERRPNEIPAKSRFTTSKLPVTFSSKIKHMRFSFPLLAAALGTVTLLAVGCQGPERKFGRGILNVTEFGRMGEIRRSMEQT